MEPYQQSPRPWPPAMQPQFGSPSHVMTEEVIMRVRHLEPQQAKEQLEHKENELETAYQWLSERHSQVLEVESQLDAKSKAFEQEVATARGQYANFQVEVRSAQNRHIQVKDELDRSIAQARARQHATEARIDAESNEVSQCKAALLRESHELRAQMASSAASEARELHSHHEQMTAESNEKIKQVEFEVDARLSERHSQVLEVESQLNEKSLAFETEVAAARDRYADFQGEVRSAQERHIEVEDELDRSIAQARARQFATEARIAAESNEVSQCKAALLQGNSEISAEKERLRVEQREVHNAATRVRDSEAHGTDLRVRAEQLQQQSAHIAAEQREILTATAKIRQTEAQLGGESAQIADAQRKVSEATTRVQESEVQHEAGLRQARMLRSLAENESHSESSIELTLRHELQVSQDKLRTIDSRARDDRQRHAAAEAERTILKDENSIGQGALRTAETRAGELERKLEATQHRLEETKAAAAELAQAVSAADAERAVQQEGEWDDWLGEPEWDLDGEQEGDETAEQMLTYQADSVPTWTPGPLSAPAPAAPAPAARATPATPAAAAPAVQPSPLEKMVESLAESVAKLANATVAGQGGQSQALDRLADAAQDQRRSLRPDKPKLSAATPAVLHAELKNLRLYFNDAKIHEKSLWMSGARAVATGRAATALNSYIIQKFGTEADFQARLLEKSWPEWPSHWRAYESLLKVTTGLDDASELSEAITIYNSVTLKNKNSPDGVDAFLQEYSAARTLMIEQGLLMAHCPKSRVREIEDLKKKLEGSEVLKYMMELPEFPIEIDDLSPEAARTTMCGRMRQWIRARRGPGMGGSSSNDASNTNNQSVFLKQQLKKVTNLLKDSKEKDQQLNFDDGKRFRATRDGKGGKDEKGRQKGDKGKARPKGGGDCSRCRGHHPECHTCPNSAASAEDGFDVSKHSKENIPCWYDHMKRGKPCGGCGHVARHHLPVLKEESKKEIEDWKAAHPKPEGKGKNKGKHKGKGKDQRLDMAETHDENRDRALKMLEALLVSNEASSNAPRRHQSTFSSSWLTATYLLWISMLWSLWSRCCRAINRRPSDLPADHFLPARISLPGGFNSRGFVWIGPARTETVFDTGSTRNSIDQDFLKALIMEPTTALKVVDVVNIEPLECGSMLQGATFTTCKMALIDVTFKEDARAMAVTKRLGFVVIRKSSEDLLIGHPTLCDLGYVPTKDGIELRMLDLQFGAVRPPDNGVHIEASLCCASNEHLCPATDGEALRTFELIVPESCRAGRWWLEAGPDLPEGVELCEGPLVARGTRAYASVLVSRDCQVHPKMRLAKARKATKADFKLLSCVHAAEIEHDATRELLEQCDAEARARANQRPCERQHRETFLESKYLKKGAKGRKEALFPELEKEIAEARKTMHQEVKWPDQNSKAFKDEIEKQSKDSIGKQLTPKQRSSFLTRVLRALSVCFWIEGCNAPRVEGFLAHIEPLPNAVPKIQQPLQLSPFDQLRLEFHEDQDVAEGKAEWVLPGEAGSWGSPSFVVDQVGKGLLGRPVRDYRYVNSQTADAPWPSANANACLQRAQRGAIHSTLDAVWGFSQLEVDESTAELLQTVARRGILRPRVLYMGPKQGPGLFQSFMDASFRPVRGPDEEEFLSIFMDDICISTEAYEGDSDDDIVERHIKHCICFLEAARSKKIQFKLAKCHWAQLEIQLLGFRITQGTRKVDPKKAESMRQWPEPRSIDDVQSFLAFANFVREFIPDFHEHARHLRPMTKKGAKFGALWTPECKAAFEALRDAIASDAELHCPDWDAAADPDSGRPFELYVDCSDFAWGAVLAQRQVAGGAPRPIAIFSKSLTQTEQAWSAFERELSGIREGLASAEPYIKGFKTVVLTDHKNNLFTGSLLANRRVNKKLLRWAIDIEEWGDSIPRVWIKGKDHVLADPLSRNPQDRDICKDLAVPAGPVRRIISQMFRKPMELDEEISGFEAFVDQLGDTDPTDCPVVPTDGENGHYDTKGPCSDEGPRAAVQKIEAAQEDSIATSASALHADGSAELLLSPVEPNASLGSPAQSSHDRQQTSGEKEYLSSPGKVPDGQEEEAQEDSLIYSEDPSSPASMMLCQLPRGEKVRVQLPAVVTEVEEEFVQAKAFVPTVLDGRYPRKHLVQFLPASLAAAPAAGDDKRLPADPTALPFRIAHVHDDKGENFVVNYSTPQVCADGRTRRSVWYKCTPSHADAERKAWAHVEAVLNRGSDAAAVDPRFGLGELQGTGRVRHHGDPHEDFRFRVHPRKPDFKHATSSIWRPQRDTLMKPEEYCKNHLFNVALASGAKIYKCLGHDVTTGEADGRAWPDCFKDGPLKGLVLVEVFAGRPDEGGARISEAWEAAGGTAIRYDERIDPAHNFLDDDEFWADHLAKPKDAYHFAFPCHHMSVARTTPTKPRDMANPYGDESDPETIYYNKMAILMVYRILKLLAGGAMVTTENPLLSYLYLFTEILGIIGLPGMCLLREDDCTTAGTPYQKARAWMSSCWGIASSISSVCRHPLPHPERLEGSRTSQSAIYPPELAEKYVIGAIAEYQNSGSFGMDTTQESARLYLEHFEALEHRIHFTGPFAKWIEAGRSKLDQVRHGKAISDTPTPDAEAEASPPRGDLGVLAGAGTMAPFGRDAKRDAFTSPGEYERAELARLQLKDPEFSDIIMAFQSFQEVEKKEGDGTTNDLVFKHLRVRLAGPTPSRAKRSDAAVNLMPHYAWDDKVLWRKVHDVSSNSFVQRLVIPAGGLRSFWFNGRKYRLSIRKQILLMYHDGELAGAHTSVRDTFAKIAQVAWWPTLERDVRNWVGSCSVCRLTKPQPGLTAEQRMELHDRPFRVLFMDTVGPVQPASAGNKYIFHVECPFSRWPWIKASPHDNAEEWAKFLVEDVFFDVAGFPAVLRSDRGAPFTSEVVKAVNTYLSVTQAFGSAYHPQSQGYLEARHKPINNVLAAYCREFPTEWAKWIKLAQWSMRSTPRADRDGKSPYEIVCGLVPQGPVRDFFAKTRGTRFMDPASYVASLHENLEKVHDQISQQMEAELSVKQARAEKSADKHHTLQIGDTVFVQRPPGHLQEDTGVSRRLLPRADKRLFKIHKFVSAQAVLLEDPDTGSTDIGIAQPVTIARLIPFSMGDFEAPVDGSQRLFLEIRNGNSWEKAEVVRQNASGAVRLRHEDGSERVRHLEAEEYHWIDQP